MTFPATTSNNSTKIPLTEHTVANIGELLAMCEEFLRTAGPSTHTELRAYLRHQVPPADRRILAVIATAVVRSFRSAFEL